MGVEEAGGAVEHFAGVGAAVTVSVFETVDVRNGIDDDGVALRTGLARERLDAAGDVEAVGEDGDFFRAAGFIEITEDAHGVAGMFGGSGRFPPRAESVGDVVVGFRKIRDRLALRVGAGGPRIHFGTGHPQPAGGIEREVERLLDFRLGGDKLDLETRRKVEHRPLLLGSGRFRVRVIATRIGGMGWNDKRECDGGEKFHADDSEGDTGEPNEFIFPELIPCRGRRLVPLSSGNSPPYP